EEDFMAQYCLIDGVPDNRAIYQRRTTGKPKAVLQIIAECTDYREGILQNANRPLRHSPAIRQKMPGTV
ncbi:MAG TPA: hypothetical protein VMQ67_13635, partial [Candidatus Saccharimonadales bacterium]|nr:hypothetical protein [Candidatus Saccharimonadales bacterium]